MSKRQIDLSGPDGNAFVLIGMARTYARQLDLDESAISEDMRSGDYAHLVGVFQQHFGNYVEFINNPYDPATAECPECEGDGCDYCNGAGEVFL